MKVRILVSFKKGVFDPEGDTIKRTLHNLGYEEVEDIKVKKIFELEIDEEKHDERRIEDIASDILSNPVIEDWEIL